MLTPSVGNGSLPALTLKNIDQKFYVRFGYKAVVQVNISSTAASGVKRKLKMLEIEILKGRSRLRAEVS